MQQVRGRSVLDLIDFFFDLEQLCMTYIDLNSLKGL